MYPIEIYGGWKALSVPIIVILLVGISFARDYYYIKIKDGVSG